MHIVRANPIFQSGLMLGAPITNSCRRGRRGRGRRGRRGRGRRGRGRRTYL